MYVRMSLSNYLYLNIYRYVSVHIYKLYLHLPYLYLHERCLFLQIASTI